MPSPATGANLAPQLIRQLQHGSLQFSEHRHDTGIGASRKTYLYKTKSCDKFVGRHAPIQESFARKILPYAVDISTRVLIDNGISKSTSKLET